MNLLLASAATSRFDFGRTTVEIGVEESSQPVLDPTGWRPVGPDYLPLGFEGALRRKATINLLAGFRAHQQPAAVPHPGRMRRLAPPVSVPVVPIPGQQGHMIERDLGFMPELSPNGKGIGRITKFAKYLRCSQKCRHHPKRQKPMTFRQFTKGLFRRAAYNAQNSTRNAEFTVRPLSSSFLFNHFLTLAMSETALASPNRVARPDNPSISGRMRHALSTRGISVSATSFNTRLKGRPRFPRQPILGTPNIGAASEIPRRMLQIAV